MVHIFRLDAEPIRKRTRVLHRLVDALADRRLVRVAEPRDRLHVVQLQSALGRPQTQTPAVRTHVHRSDRVRIAPVAVERPVRLAQVERVGERVLAGDEELVRLVRVKLNNGLSS